MASSRFHLLFAFGAHIALSPVYADVTNHHLMLLQRNVLSSGGQVRVRGQNTAPSAGIGEGVPLSEKGYQTVVALKSDEEMKKFIRRLAEKEARRITDDGNLNGLVPYYSGTIMSRSMESLKQELRNAPWVVDGEGRTAPLSEAGYKQVAQLKSKPHMLAFSRRILDAYLKKSSDEGALRGLVPYFDGEVSVQSFDQLKQELLSARWAVARESEDVAPKISQVSLKESTKHASSQRTEGPFDILGWFQHEDSDAAETKAKQDHADSSGDETDTSTVEDAKHLAKTSVAQDDRAGDASDDDAKHAAKKRASHADSSGDEINASTGEADAKHLAKTSVAQDETSRVNTAGDATDDEGDADEEAATETKIRSSEASKSPEDRKHSTSTRCDDWCSKDMFVKVEANSTVMKNLSSWAMKCSWAYCGGCSICSDASLKMEEPPSRKQDVKKQQLRIDDNTCDDWCSSDEFEVVHQNVTSTKEFSWDLKCGWRYCRACSRCDGNEASLLAVAGPLDILGWFRHEASDSAETNATKASKHAANKQAEKDEQVVYETKLSSPKATRSHGDGQ